MDELRSLGKVEVEPGRAVICVVGEGLRRTSGIARRVFEAIRDINVLLISQGASQVNLTFVVEESRVGDAVRGLHSVVLDKTAFPTAPHRELTAPGDVAAFTRQLIDIPSVSGDEIAIAETLAAFFSRLGYRVDLQEAAPGRPNLLATTGAAPRIVLCTHLDTVAPFVGSEEDDQYVYGRGACDAKGIIATQIAAAARLRQEGVEEFGLLFVVDEEAGSLGARAANAHPRARESRYVVVGEPTGNRLAVGCKGSLRAALLTEGTGGHSAYPEHGTSAIHELLAVLSDLQACDWPSDEFFGATTLNVGIISGGMGTNVLAPSARADVHLRLATPAGPVREQLDRTVAGRARVEFLSETPPVRLGSAPEFDTCVVGFTTDAAHLGCWGRPFLLGPGSIHDAHMPRERVAKAELARGVELYVGLVRALLSEPADDGARFVEGSVPR